MRTPKLRGKKPIPSSRSSRARETAAIALPRPFPSRYGVPILSAVEATVFERHYFTDCMACTFCHDWCCSHGVDVDLVHLRALQAHRAALQAFTGIPESRWFRSRVSRDQEMPGGGSVRTRVVDGACVFQDRTGRGCRVHAYCIERGLDYHELKPMVDCLFPLTFSQGTLTTAAEVEDHTLVCLDTGPTLYRGLRGELEYYFGPELVGTLDRIEASLA